MNLSTRRVAAKIVSQRPDGRGGIVQIPVARASNVDLAKTAGEGSGSMEVSPEIFDQIAANFATKPGPVGLYDEHKKNRKGKEPHLGAVLDAWKADDLLWNEVDLTPAGWKLLVEDRQVVGASIEAELDPEFPTAKLKGWAQTGVVATNNPALDVQFYFESATNKFFAGYPVMFGFGDDPSKETEMKTVTLETLAAEKLALEEKLAQFEKDQKVKDDKLAALQAEKLELEKRPKPETLIALDAKVMDLETRYIATEVKGIVNTAIAAGKAPKHFEGALADPTKFLKEHPICKGDLAAFQALVDVLPVVAKLGAGQGPGSGGNGGSSVGTAKQKLIAEARKIEAAEKIGFSDALYKVRERDPKLFEEATAEYNPAEVEIH